MKTFLAWIFLLTTSACLSDETILFQDEDLTSWNPRYLRKGQKNTCLSQATEKTTAAVSPISSHLELGGNYTYAHITPSGHSSSSGSLGGIQALYEFKTPNRIYAAITGAWRQGNLSGSGGTRFLVEIDAQERIGYTWGSLRKGRMFSLFSGLGYRRFIEHVKEPGDSIKFYYNELYMPVGFLLKGRLTSFFSMGLNFQWMPQVYPTLTIVPLKGARWILSTKIANVRFEIPLIMRLLRNPFLTLSIQPFFEFWQDGHTHAKTQTGLILDVPGNTYLLGGVDLNFRYSF